MFTRRSASRATTAQAAGTPTATARMSGRLSDSSAGKNGWPVNGMAASGTRSTKNRPKPAATPATAARVDSTAAISEICLGVAPTSRIAANRCSRRAADNRVAVPMRISTGSRSASATTDRTRLTPPELRPPRITQLFRMPQPLGAVVLRLVTFAAPGRCDICAAERPTTMTSEPGDGRPASPMRPAWCPG